jgi:hypothetical protein
MEKNNTNSEFEIINSGKSDEFDLLDSQALDLIYGGKTSCHEGYSKDGDTVKCGCEYTSNDGPTVPTH